MSITNQINYYLNHCVYFDDIELINNNELFNCIEQLIEDNNIINCGSYYNNKQLYLVKD